MFLNVTNCTFGYTYSRETAKHTALQAIQKEFSLFGRSWESTFVTTREGGSSSSEECFATLDNATCTRNIHEP